MFERNIDETIARLRKETIEGGDSITSHQIFASSMPLALKRMFEADIDIWVCEENERLLRSPHFRYDEAEMQILFEQIRGKARDYATFTVEEYNAALDKNVKLFFNYVCRPQWTLVKYLFAEREHASTDDVIDALKTFWHYEYYRIILREYFEKKKLSVINVKKFTELIEQIDLEVVRNFDSRKTAHLSEPLFELFNIGAMSEDAMAPIEALSIFYDDKNLSSIVEHLDVEKQNHEMMTLHDLVLLIGDADFTLGMDISTIVNEQFNQQGVMKPERNVTAGQDFDVPPILTDIEEEFHHGDLGHENDALDFVISVEEDGVIVQEEDHITPSRNESDFSTEYSNSGFPETTETDDKNISEVADNEDDEMSHTPTAQNENETESAYDENAFSYTDDGILNLEAEFDTSSKISFDKGLEENEAEESDVEESDAILPPLFLGDDENLPSDDALSKNIEIPDITLEGLGSISFGEEVEEESSFGEEEDDIDPYMNSTISEELEGTEDVIREEQQVKNSSNDEIDWDKEAEELVDMGDINLDDIENDEQSISDSISENNDPFKQEDQLKPAEELLGSLDLDDLEPEPVRKPSRQNDFPIIEDETPLPQTQRSINQEKDEEIEGNGVSSEAVIREFGDLNQLLTVADRKKYSKKLFNKNEEAFTRALQVLNGKTTWRQASEYIDELFIKHDIDMYSRLAVKFTDDIYKRYANKK